VNEAGQPPALYCSEECRVRYETSIGPRLDALESRMSDHDQRLSTAQSHQWKRVLFWLDGWPMTDWNAPRRHWRPWHRSR
jgi:hypothetical protein